MDRLAVVYPSDIPAELKKFNQWVLWQAEPCGDRVSKVPYRLDGRRASSMNPNDWTGFETAWGAYISPGLGRRFSGIGFVFRAGGGIVGIDVDHVVTDGVVEPWVTRTIEAFNSYTELSVSGTGLHILCGGSLPDGKGRKREPVEMYCQGRYFTMSGNVFG
jgi:putative DNA primase/helicase